MEHGDARLKLQVSHAGVAVYFVCLASLSWLLMQGIHELGHVLGAWAVGGRIERVVLHPLTISRTDVEPDLAPEARLVEVAAGPLFGVLFPAICLIFTLRMWLVAAHALKFLAGFCLIANGAYLGFGSFEGLGDAGDLLQLGCPRWTLWLFGVATSLAGLLCWHFLGPRCGWALLRNQLRRRDIAIAAAAVIVVVALECVLSPR